MLRFLLLLVFPLFFNLSISAQDYRLFQPDSLRLYQCPTSNYLDGLFIDSTSISGQDTFYFNFGVVEENFMNSTCMRINKPIFIGKKVIVKPNGITVLFNVQDDSIFININAGLSDSWIMYTYSNGDNIIAEVDSIYETTILNISDSVKRISLKVIDSIGNPVAGSVNGLQIELSKDHGIFKALYFPEFPDSFDPYDLQNRRMMTIGDLYHFSIGDTIQISSQYEFQGIYSPVNYFTTTIYDIYYSPAGDTMFYANDSALNYSYVTNLNDPVIQGYPGRILDGDCHYFRLYMDSSCAGQKMILDDLRWGAVFVGDDSCYFDLFEPGRILSTYYEGTGTSLYYFSDPPGSPQGGYFSWQQLYFYSHGIYRCGTYFDPTIGINELIKRQDKFLSVYPNPVIDHIKFSRKKNSVQQEIIIEVFDFSGRVLIKKYIAATAQSIEFNLSEYNSGLYFFSAKSENQIIQNGTFIKVE
ncbi:MAG: T9SS type A sorting domain-containing protein [Bacteroidota bacterium]